MAKSSLPRLIIFGDQKKARVAEAVIEFTDFVKDRAEILASCSAEDCKLLSLYHDSTSIDIRRNFTLFKHLRE